MKFKLTLIMMLSGFLFLFGCTHKQASETERLERLNPDGRLEETSDNEELSAKLGFVRYTKEEVDVDGEQRVIDINRDEMAEIITRTMLKSGNFQEVATLVTDKEVVIAFDKREDFSSTDAADFAKKTARSLLPSFYEIYTTEQEGSLDIIHSLHREQTNNPNNKQVIERVIEDLK